MRTLSSRAISFSFGITVVKNEYGTMRTGRKGNEDLYVATALSND